MKTRMARRIVFAVRCAAVPYGKRLFLLRLFTDFTWIDFECRFLPFSPTPFLPLLFQRRFAHLGALSSVTVAARFASGHIPFGRSCCFQGTLRCA
ncbi:MAG: hypothetical protein IJQ98_11760 [Oscillospiraceae bacterium]|nr:hypothetical protein [Oscillospiraceae bacterium]